MIQQFHFWVYAQKKWKQDFEQIYELPCLLSIIYKTQDTETT